MSETERSQQFGPALTCGAQSAGNRDMYGKPAITGVAAPNLLERGKTRRRVVVLTPLAGASETDPASCASHPGHVFSPHSA